MTNKVPIYRWRFALLQRYRNKTLPTLVILLGDLLLYAVAFSIGEIFYIWGGNGLVWSELYSKLLLTLMLTTLSFIAIGTHRTILRHFGINDIGKLLLSVALPAIVLYILRIVALSYPFINLALLPGFTEITLTYALLFLFMVLYRLASQQIYNDLFRRHGIEQHVLIYGAGAAGIIACNALKQDLRQDYIIDAYIDDDKSKYGQKINGIRVCSADEALNERYVAEHRVQTLIIAMPTVKTDKRQAIIGRGLDLGLTVKSVPHINTWINHTFQSNQIESIKIEDLLEREVIHVNERSMRESIANKVVLVTGAAGSIGSEICRQLTGLNPRQIVMLDIAESAIYDLQYELRNSEPYKAMADRMVFLIADVRDRQRLEHLFSLYQPEIVYHAAAYKHVPLMESFPYEAVRVNIFGTRNMVDLAIEHNVKRFVMISTDKAVNPTNVMGASKRIAEMYVQSRHAIQTQFITTRFGNVLGSNGSVVPLFKKQLAAGGPLTVTHHDIIRYFMTIPEACSLVLEAGAMGQGGDIFVFDMGKPVRIYDLAQRMIQLSGLYDIKIVETGLRPGEKLYEELLANKENTLPTNHPKIMHAKVSETNAETIERQLAALWEATSSSDDTHIVEIMKQIVPEYISNNSEYSKLDKKQQ